MSLVRNLQLFEAPKLDGLGSQGFASPRARFTKEPRGPHDWPFPTRLLHASWCMRKALGRMCPVFGSI